MAVIRGESWVVTWSPQYRDDGTGLTDVEYSDSVVYAGWLDNMFGGIFSGANLPDPSFDYDKRWAYGELGNRNYNAAYKSKAVLSGGIGDIMVLDGSALRIPFGPCATTLPTSGSLGATTVDQACTAGSVTVYLTTPAQFSATDIICIGGAIPGTYPPSAACEYAMVKTVNVGDVEIYKHIEFTNVSGTLNAAATITGGTSGATLALQMATGKEAHGDVTLGGGTKHFEVGETLTGTGGWTAKCTRSDSGLRNGHMVGTQVIEVTDHAEDGLLKAGKTSVVVSAAGDWTTGDYMCIGYGSPYAEVRQITLASTTASFTRPLSYDHGHSGGLCKVTAAGGVYTHTICESVEIPSIQIAADYVDVDGAAALMRRYVCCKANRGSYRAAEGSVLRFGIDDIVARTMRYRDIDASGETGGTYHDDLHPWYSGNINHVTATLTCDEPYYFSYGQLTFGGSSIARVREFSLEVTNGMEPKYYMTDSSNPDNEGFVPWEIREGRREYRCTITVDVDPNERNIFADLVRMGEYSSVYKGFQVTLVFTRGASDTITFSLPPARNETTVPACGGDLQGCLVARAPHGIQEQPLVSVPIELEVRSVGIVVQDDIQYYP